MLSDYVCLQVVNGSHARLSELLSVPNLLRKRWRLGVRIPVGTHVKRAAQRELSENGDAKPKRERLVLAAYSAQRENELPPSDGFNGRKGIGI